MYLLRKDKLKGKRIIKDLESFLKLDGFIMNSRGKSFLIEGECISNIKVIDYEIASCLTEKQVNRKYQNLINKLTDLITSDDDSGECFREALNQIEKFRLEIKNKYRLYLKKKELAKMAKQLSLLQKEAKERYLILQRSYEEYSKEGKSR